MRSFDGSMMRDRHAKFEFSHSHLTAKAVAPQLTHVQICPARLGGTMPQPKATEHTILATQAHMPRQENQCRSRTNFPRTVAVPRRMLGRRTSNAPSPHTKMGRVNVQS